MLNPKTPEIIEHSKSKRSRLLVILTIGQLVFLAHQRKGTKTSFCPNFTWKQINQYRMLCVSDLHGKKVPILFVNEFENRSRLQ